jgi:hypothetical protein
LMSMPLRIVAEQIQKVLPGITLTYSWKTMWVETALDDISGRATPGEPLAWVYHNILQAQCNIYINENRVHYGQFKEICEDGWKDKMLGKGDWRRLMQIHGDADEHEPEHHNKGGGKSHKGGMSWHKTTLELPTQQTHMCDKYGTTA